MHLARVSRNNTLYISWMVEDRRIELLLHACKAHVLPLSLIPRNFCYVLLRRTLVAVWEACSLEPRGTARHSIKRCCAFWWRQMDSNHRAVKRRFTVFRNRPLCHVSITWLFRKELNFCLSVISRLLYHWATKQYTWSLFYTDSDIFTDFTMNSLSLFNNPFGKLGG